MSNTIIEIILVFEVIISIVIGATITIKADNERNKIITTALYNYIKELFVNRNLFGIVLGAIVFVFGIPAFLIIILIQLVILLYELLVKIWNLGNKK